MSERTIEISPYAKADGMIDLRGHVTIDGVAENIEIPDKMHLILYNYSLTDGTIIVPRNHEYLRLSLKPSMADGIKLSDFNHLLLNGESYEKVLRFRIQVWCKHTNWCSVQNVLKLDDIVQR